MESAVKLFYHIEMIVPCDPSSVPANFTDEQLEITFLLSKDSTVKMFFNHLEFFFWRQYSKDIYDKIIFIYLFKHESYMIF